MYGKLLAVLLFFVLGCSAPPEKVYMFELLGQDVTGLHFENTLVQTKEFNVFNYMYFFNGAGVGVGDFNNDGRDDLYFAGNLVPNKLFLNRGNMKFEDVTHLSGADGNGGWSSGVSVVDINNDGLLDIYVSQVGDFRVLKGKNRLYINKGVRDGIPVFEDEAAAYGLDLVAFATQAIFFDYDLDGDLDMYQLNHSVHENGTFGQRRNFIGKQHATSGDRLFRNDKGRFTDVTIAAGIHSLVIGYGLGVVAGDVNDDGWPDIYVGNDFHENDYLYINKQDGTFREELNERIMHTSRFSMGVDIADINNDGLNDIFSLDMLPYDPFILKSSLGEDDYSIFQFKLKYGYNVQFARNNLQLNNGDGTFSEIGMFAGVHASDWSWASLFMDFDHDGYKDIFVSNGIPRRMNDIDYVNFREANQDHRWKTQANRIESKDLYYLDHIPQIKLPNKFYRNNGNLRFDDIEEAIIGSRPSYSNGAAYADLDNDGDLDVVVNNINEAPFIYRNLTTEQQHSDAHYLKIIFRGPPMNINGIGARVEVHRNGEALKYEHFPVRGFQSSVAYGVHVGLGDGAEVDSIVVIWPDRRYNRLPEDGYDTTLTVTWSRDLPHYTADQKSTDPDHYWKDETESTGLDYLHEENPFIEFNRERLIPFMVSTEGPALAVGDINGDGLDDVFFGSAKREKSVCYIQKPGGRFYSMVPDLIARDSIYEDVDATFVDVDNDGDLDLAVASGGNEYWDGSEYLQQRLYINDGSGRFERRIIFEGAMVTASCVLAHDFDSDGLADLFFGGRAVPYNYGKMPQSYLFRNLGNGNFRDVTAEHELAGIGMVRDGQWMDMDKDGDKDLVLAIEWGSVTVFVNNDGRLERNETKSGLGWWGHVRTADFDNDGDIDILAGNVGLNTRFRPSPSEPLRLYVQDFDNNGHLDQILTYYLDGREIPFANYFELTKQIPSLKKKYLYAKDFAAASVEELFGEDKIEKAVVLQAETLASIFMENNGKMEFTVHNLPDRLQFSNLAASEVHSSNTGDKVVIVGGNFYDNNIEMGRYDANYGNILKISGNGAMSVSPLRQLKIRGQVRKIKGIRIASEQYYIYARNNDKALVIGAVKEPGTMKMVHYPER